MTELHATPFDAYPLEPRFTLEEIRAVAIQGGLITCTFQQGDEVKIKTAPIEYLNTAEREAVLAFLCDFCKGGIQAKPTETDLAKHTRLTTADLEPLTDDDFETIEFDEAQIAEGASINPVKIRGLKDPRPQKETNCAEHQNLPRPTT